MMSEEERLEKFKEIFNFLLEKATGNYDIKRNMALNGYNYDEITREDIKKYIEDWEREDLGSYTEYKVDQGMAFYSNYLLNYMTGNFFSQKFVASENDEALFKYYEEKVMDELVKKVFPDKYNPDNVLSNEKLIYGFLYGCQDYLKQKTFGSSQSDKYINTITELFYENKEHFKDLAGYRENPDNVNDIIAVINTCLSQNNVRFPGESYFKIYDGEKDLEPTQMTKTSPEYKDVVESINVLKELGIELTAEQENMLNTSTSLNKEEIEENVRLAIEKNIKLSEERVAWQNSPKHPDNLRLESLRAANLIVEKLTKLDEFGMLSKDQIEKMNEYKDFIKYSRDVMERNPDGMSEEVRQEMQKFYADQEEEQIKANLY